MKALANTKSNKAKIEALKKVSGTKWVGNTIHPNIQLCLTAMNLDSSNSGHYNPSAVRIAGLHGIWMVNEDGSLFCEARIMKEGEKEYRIEYMIMSAWNDFENHYCDLL